MDVYLALKLIHLLGAAVLFGTGLGIAFFMWMANRSRDPVVIAHTARIVVVADAVFTAVAVVLQPITGVLLAAVAGFNLFEFWIALTVTIYIAVGLCWLPVVWIQVQLRDLAARAVRDGTALPERYHRLYRIWFWLGWPAFGGVLVIFALMLWKPVL
jgi:uncharacterized membrane protein